MKRTLLLLLFTLLLPAAYAQVPQTLGYQGVLTGDDGKPVADGNHELTFSLYDQATDGDVLWTETQTLTTTNGVFSAALGAVTPLSLPFDAPYWLGVAVGSDDELAPRIALLAAAYSLSSRGVVNEPADGESFAIRDAGGNPAHRLSPDGNVLHTGVGTFDGGLIVGPDTTTVIEPDTSVTGTTAQGKRLDGLPEIGLGVAASRIGVLGSSDGGRGVQGQSQTNTGVFGNSVSGIGVHGNSTSNTGVYGRSATGKGVFGRSTESIGVQGQSTNNTGVYGLSTIGWGVQGQSTTNIGVRGVSTSESGVYGQSTSGRGAYGKSDTNTGVYGLSISGQGVTGQSTSGLGVFGVSAESIGVQGQSTGNTGVYGTSTSGTGVHANSVEATGLIAQGNPAGHFKGQVVIDAVEVDANQERILVWSGDNYVRYRTLPSGGSDTGWLLDSEANTVSTSNTVVLKDSEGTTAISLNPEEGIIHFLDKEGEEWSNLGHFGYTLYMDEQKKTQLSITDLGIEIIGEDGPLFSVGPDGTSYHAAEETFAGGITLQDAAGNTIGVLDDEGIKVVDANGETLGGFGRTDLDTGQRIGVFGRADEAGDLGGAFEGDVEVDGELRILNADGDVVTSFSRDGTSFHAGEETFAGGITLQDSEGRPSIKLDQEDGVISFIGESGSTWSELHHNGYDLFFDEEMNNGFFIDKDDGMWVQDKNGVRTFNTMPDGRTTLRNTLEMFDALNMLVFSLNPFADPFTQYLMGLYGNLVVHGLFEAQQKDFKIDHPLDPANKYLRHTSVESSDVMNLYNGNAVLDADGGAWVEMPDWFEALNTDFRYQLTPIGAPGPGLYIAEEVQGGRFKIAGGTPGMKVSWQVTGTRQDAYAKTYRRPVEEDKVGDERGRYLSPEAFGLPASLRIQPATQQLQLQNQR